jgi:hypothetical protein
MSGTGKSTALAELGRRGFRVVDTDSPCWSESSTTSRTVEPRLRAASTHEVDASRPLEEVVDAPAGIAGR